MIEPIVSAIRELELRREIIDQAIMRLREVLNWGQHVNVPIDGTWKPPAQIGTTDEVPEKPRKRGHTWNAPRKETTDGPQAASA